MIKEVTKPEKVALCRECHGTGKVTKLGFSRNALTVTAAAECL